MKGGQSLADAAAVAGVTVRRSPLRHTRCHGRGGKRGAAPCRCCSVWKKGRTRRWRWKPRTVSSWHALADVVEADPKADPAGYGRARAAVVARSIASDQPATTFADALRARAQFRAINPARSRQHHRSATMNVTVAPGYASFRSAYEAGRGTLVWRRGVADLETPVAAFLKLAHGRPNSFLLESVEGGAARGRYSIIGMQPDLIWRCREGRAEVNRYALSAPHAFLADPRPALESLRAMIDETRLEVPAHLPPMSGGLVGYLGYDMVRLMEELPTENPDVIGVPDALMLRPTLFAIFDNVNDELTLVAPVYPRQAGDQRARQRGNRARQRLDEAEAAHWRTAAAASAAAGDAAGSSSAGASNISKPDFLAAVDRCKDYIAAGDAFQIVHQPALSFSVPFALPPFSLYRAPLAPDQPGAVHCSSLISVVSPWSGRAPEVLVRLRDGSGDRSVCSPVRGGAAPHKKRKTRRWKPSC